MSSPDISTARRESEKKGIKLPALQLLDSTLYWIFNLFVYVIKKQNAELLA